MDDQAAGEALRAHLSALVVAGEHWCFALHRRRDRTFLSRLLTACHAVALRPRPTIELVALDFHEDDADGEAHALGPGLAFVAVPKRLLPAEAVSRLLHASYGPGGTVDQVERAAVICPVRLDELWETGAQVQALSQWLGLDDEDAEMEG